MTRPARFRAGRFRRVTRTVVAPTEEVADLLRKAGQGEWDVHSRLCGLQVLVAFVVKRQPKFPDGMPVSRDLAHQYVSRIWCPKSDGTIQEPLELLCRIGILRRVKPAVNFDSRMAALYLVSEECTERIPIKLDVPNWLAKKLREAPVRREARLNRRHPFRAQLKLDLPKFTFSPEARPVIAQLLANRKKRPAVTRALTAMTSGAHSLSISDLGLVTTSVGMCPKELKPFLLLDGEPTVSCDIGCAHFSFLPVLVAGRIAYLRKNYPDARTAHLEEELHRLVELLSSADFYLHSCGDTEDDSERKRRKKLLNVMLNSPTSRIKGIGPYMRLREQFPLTIKICEDVKRKDHRDISVILQGLTAKATNGALLETQRLLIPAAPDTDGIRCKVKDSAIVCWLVGHQVYNLTGVCCKVGGIRYAPISTPMACFNADGLQSESQVPEPQAMEAAVSRAAVKSNNDENK